jgi:predicted SnoaL-like aldol condensation-catalyzing enzyme
MNRNNFLLSLWTTAMIATGFFFNHSIKNKTGMNNKEKAAFVNKAVQAGDTTGIPAIVRQDYIQHTPVVADGLSGLLGLIEKINLKQIPAPVIKNVRVFEDGNFVVLHHDVHWPNRKAMFEVFRFQDGLAAEHWSGIADQPEKTANGHTMIDGATEVTDRSLTQQNKALARSFVETILIKGEFERILEFYHPDIIQHNPYIDNTVPGLVKGIKELAANGISIQIQTIKQVLGEGNFVLIVSEGKFAGKHTAFFDLFRIEKGIIVEHWDVLQEVPEKMAHANGMF